MSTEWDQIGYVISSKYRIAVLRQLAAEPSTPTTIADESGLGITHISRALRRLREREMVELLVPEARQKGRLYAMTELGESVWKHIVTTDLLP